MRDPERETGPAPRGGKARLRLDEFRMARGLMDPSFDYRLATGVAQAIANAPAGSASLPLWRFVGPDLTTNGQTMTPGVRVPVSGRVQALAVDPGNRNHLLCGSATGGIWESFTGGADWAPRTDFQPTLTIGAVAFDPGNPSVVYAGTGEGNKYWFYGQGVLRSTDGGTTWAMIATTRTTFVGVGFFKIIVDPANSQHLLAATTAGVYESSDSGSTWTRRYSSKTWDISMAPASATVREVLAGTVNGLMISTNGGTTWNPPAQSALDSAPTSWDRIAVCIAPSDPATAFVLGADAADKPTPYLWRRSGGAWSKMNTPADLQTKQAWSDWYIAVAPDSANRVYVGCFDAHRGDLPAGGSNFTWTNLSTKAAGDCIHPDIHGFSFDPVDSSTVYCICDGGAFRSPDRGSSWLSLNCGLGIAEIEYTTLDNTTSQWLLAGTQDTGTILYQGTTAFDTVGDGDGGDCGADPANPGTCYHSYFKMGVDVSTTRGARGSFTSIGPTPASSYNSLFYPPMAVASGTVAQAGQSVYLSRDKGKTWTNVPLPTGLVATAMCAPTGDLFYIATQASNLTDPSGRIFKITYSSSSGTWIGPTELPNSPRSAYVSAIFVAGSSANSRIWVTISQIGGGTVFRSDDGGTTWANMTAGLPAIPINSIAVDPANAARVWVSADVGVYQSLNSGGTWSGFYQNLPNVLVADLQFHAASRRLRAATRSRGVWEVAVDQPGPSAQPPGMNACLVLQNNSGGLQVFGAATGKTLGYWSQSASALGGWSAWSSLGGGVTSALAGLTLADGTMHVFARGNDGALYRIRQVTLGYAWSNWERLGGFITGNPTVVRDVTPPATDGTVDVFARGADGALLHIYQYIDTYIGSWSNWTTESLGGVITSTPAAALNVDGRLEVFARGSDGALWHIYQKLTGTPWSNWESLGGNLVGEPAVGKNTDGRLEVFARGADGTLGHIYQWNPPASNVPGPPGVTWSTWQSLGGNLAGDPAVAANQDGRLEAFARWTDGTLRHVWQDTSMPTGWSSWDSLGGTITSDPIAILDQNGQIEVFARWTDNTVWPIMQATSSSSYANPSGNGWTMWVQGLGGAVLVFP